MTSYDPLLPVSEYVHFVDPPGWSGRRRRYLKWQHNSAAVGVMAGRPPKPEGQKVTRHPRVTADVVIPRAGRGDAPAPMLPGLIRWQGATLEWWAALWRKPQALLWDDDDPSLWRLAILFDQNMIGGDLPSAVAAEMRQIENAHGLNPGAMKDLRWTIEDDGEAAPEARPGSAVADLDGRRKRLKVV